MRRSEAAAVRRVEQDVWDVSRFLDAAHATLKQDGLAATEAARRTLDQVGLGGLATDAAGELIVVGAAYVLNNMEHATRLRVAAEAVEAEAARHKRDFKPGLSLKASIDLALEAITLRTPDGQTKALLRFTVTDWTWLRDRERAVAAAAKGRAMLADMAAGMLREHNAETAEALPKRVRHELASAVAKAWQP